MDTPICLVQDICHLTINELYVGSICLCIHLPEEDPSGIEMLQNDIIGQSAREALQPLWYPHPIVLTVEILVFSIFEHICGLALVSFHQSTACSPLKKE